MKFILVIESPKIYVTTVTLIITVDTVWTLIFQTKSSSVPSEALIRGFLSDVTVVSYVTDFHVGHFISAVGVRS